jgi:hypothetical protein
VQPWRAETFTFSTDPELVAEVTDVVGVYLAPPQDAVVLCVDEKTEIQAWATFRSVRDLTAKIRAFIDGWNDRRHPFTWTKTADQILTKAHRQETSRTDH